VVTVVVAVVVAVVRQFLNNELNQIFVAINPSSALNRCLSFFFLSIPVNHQAVVVAVPTTTWVLMARIPSLSRALSR
jgi:chromate transport protein ChrA